MTLKPSAKLSATYDPAKLERLRFHRATHQKSATVSPTALSPATPRRVV